MDLNLLRIYILVVERKHPLCLYILTSVLRKEVSSGGMFSGGQAQRVCIRDRPELLDSYGRWRLLLYTSWSPFKMNAFGVGIWHTVKLCGCLLRILECLGLSLGYSIPSPTSC